MRAVCALVCRYQRNPWLWGLAAMLPFLLFPSIDLWVSGWFYRAGDGFFMKSRGIFMFVLKDMPPWLIGLAVLALVVAFAGRVLGRVLFGVTGRVALYLVTSLALGPGLIVNVLLKDNWGRARPSQIAEFGGGAHFSPPLWISDQCTRNCSFSSGHAALGFWVFALALLAPRRYRAAAVGASLIFGLFVGFVRIAQGGHFLSDVLASGAIVIAVTLTLRRLILNRGGEDCEAVRPGA